MCHEPRKGLQKIEVLPWGLWLIAIDIVSYGSMLVGLTSYRHGTSAINISMELTCASTVGLPFFPDGVE